jgi:putative ABC transport system ATP-binding protein
MIEFDGVYRTYAMGDQILHALDDVSEAIEAGDYVAVVGPSGSGKSTLLNVLGCLDRPSRGVYRLDGEDVGSLSEEELSSIRRHKIGFVFQSFHLISRLDAAENVAFPMVFAGVPRAERRERVAAALSTVGLQERAGHRPAELSGGEQQRVAIARATVMRPQVLLADEPTGNLDSSSGRQVMEVLEGMNADGLTLIVVTHDPAMAGRANRALVMQDGRIVQRARRGEFRGGPIVAPSPGPAS